MGVKNLLRFIEEHSSQILQSLLLEEKKASSGQQRKQQQVWLIDGYGFFIQFAASAQHLIASAPDWLKIAIAATSEKPPTPTASSASSSYNRQQELAAALWCALRHTYPDQDIVGGDCRLIALMLDAFICFAHEQLAVKFVFVIDAPRGTDEWADELVSAEEKAALRQRHQVWSRRELEKTAITHQHYAFSTGKAHSKHAQKRQNNNNNKPQQPTTILPHMYFAAVRQALLQREAAAVEIINLDCEVDDELGQLAHGIAAKNPGADIVILSSDTDFPVIMGRSSSNNINGSSCKLALLQFFPFFDAIASSLRFAGILVPAASGKLASISTLNIVELQKSLGIPSPMPAQLADFVVHVAASLAGNDITSFAANNNNNNTAGKLQLPDGRSDLRIEEIVSLLVNDSEFMNFASNNVAKQQSPPQQQQQQYDGAIMKLISQSATVKLSLQTYARASSAFITTDPASSLTTTTTTSTVFAKTMLQCEKRIVMNITTARDPSNHQQKGELAAFFQSIATGALPSHFLPMFLFGELGVFHRPPPYAELTPPYEQLPTVKALHSLCQSLLTAQRDFCIDGKENSDAATPRVASPASVRRSVLDKFFSFGGENSGTLMSSFVACVLAVCSPALHLDEVAIIALFLHLQQPQQERRPAAASNGAAVPLTAVFIEAAAEAQLLDARPDARTLELAHIVASAVSTVSSAMTLFGYSSIAAATAAAASPSFSLSAVSFGTLFHALHALHLSHLAAAATRNVADLRAMQKTVAEWVLSAAGGAASSKLLFDVGSTLQTTQFICEKWRQRDKQQHNQRQHATSSDEDDDDEDLAARLGLKPGSRINDSRFSQQWLGVLQNEELLDMMDEGGGGGLAQGVMVDGGDEDDYHGNQQQQQQQQQQPDAKQLERIKGPSRLPIEDHIPQLLLRIAASRVFILSASTGSGKSSFLPLELIRANPSFEIICTQPRRIAAVSLARRVSSLLGEQVGQTVGYRLGGGDHCDSGRTRLRYVTTGYLLEALLAANSAPRFFASCTHLLLDECHERSLQADMLSLVAKLMLVVPPTVSFSSATAAANNNSYNDDDDYNVASPIGTTGTPTLHHHQQGAAAASAASSPFTQIGKEKRLIVMSATIQSQVFRGYFKSLCEPKPVSFIESHLLQEGDALEDLLDGADLKRLKSHRLNKKGASAAEPVIQLAPSYSIDTACFGVKTMYIDDVIATLSDKIPAEALRSLRGFRDKLSRKPKQPLGISRDPNIISAICTVILACATAGSLLVFLPGLDEIETVMEHFAQQVSVRGKTRMRIKLFCLHSIVDSKTQQEIVQPAENGVIKVILGTPIMETSITVPDAMVVVDLGAVRRMSFDTARGVRALTTQWASRSSCKQRRGRVGRTGPGLYIALFSQEIHDDVMSPFCPSEMLPLDYSLLQILGSGLSAYGKIEEVVQQLVDPPPPDAVRTSLANLVRCGALGVGGDGDDGNYVMLDLGRIALALPVDVQATKAILNAAALGVAPEMVVMIAGLSSPRCIHQKPLSTFFRDSETEFVRALAAVIAGRSGLAGPAVAAGSDFHLYLAVYELFSGQQRHHVDARVWRSSGCENFLARSCVSTFMKYVQQITKCLLAVVEKTSAAAEKAAASASTGRKQQQQQQDRIMNKQKKAAKEWGLSSGKEHQQQQQQQQSSDESMIGSLFTAQNYHSLWTMAQGGYVNFSGNEEDGENEQHNSYNRSHSDISTRSFRLQLALGTSSQMTLQNLLRINDSSFFNIVMRSNAFSTGAAAAAADAAARNRHVNAAAPVDVLAEQLSRTVVLQNFDAGEFAKLGLTTAELQKIVKAGGGTAAAVDHSAVAAQRAAEGKLAAALRSAFSYPADSNGIIVSVDAVKRNVVITFPPLDNGNNNNNNNSTEFDSLSPICNKTFALHPHVAVLCDMKRFHAAKRSAIPLGRRGSSTAAKPAAWGEDPSAEQIVEVHPASFVSVASTSGICLSTVAASAVNAAALPQHQNQHQQQQRVGGRGTMDELVSKVVGVKKVITDRWSGISPPQGFDLPFIQHTWSTELTIVGAGAGMYAVQNTVANTHHAAGAFLTNLATPLVQEALFAGQCLCVGVKTTSNNPSSASSQQQKKNKQNKKSNKQQRRQQEQKPVALDEGVFIVSIVPGHQPIQESPFSYESDSDSDDDYYSGGDDDDDSFTDDDDDDDYFTGDDDDEYYDSDGEDDDYGHHRHRRHHHRHDNRGEVQQVLRSSSASSPPLSAAERSMALLSQETRPEGSGPQLLGIHVPLHMLLEANVLLRLLALAKRPTDASCALEKRMLLRALEEMLELNRDMPELNDPAVMASAATRNAVLSGPQAGGLDPATILGGKKKSVGGGIGAKSIAEAYYFLPLTTVPCAAGGGNGVPLFDIDVIFPVFNVSVPSLKAQIYGKVFAPLNPAVHNVMYLSRRRPVVNGNNLISSNNHPSNNKNNNNDDDDDDEILFVQPTIAIPLPASAAAAARARSNSSSDDSDDHAAVKTAAADAAATATAKAPPKLQILTLQYCKLCSCSFGSKALLEQHEESDKHLQQVLRQGSGGMPKKWTKTAVPSLSSPFEYHLFAVKTRKGTVTAVCAVCGQRTNGKTIEEVRSQHATCLL